MTQARLYFITDPICAWCWGMLPEVLRAQQALSSRVTFILCCAGLQVGNARKLTEFDINNLTQLWARVNETTGQSFSIQLPADEDFIYHSEIPSRYLQVARARTGEEPWSLFHQMQEAFYVGARNLNNPDTLASLDPGFDMSAADIETAIRSDDIIETTRAEFEWCRELTAHNSLPTVMLDTGDGAKLLCGGYASADYLIPDIVSRLS